MIHTSEPVGNLGENEAIVSSEEQAFTLPEQVSKLQKRDICLPGQECNPGEGEIPSKPPHDEGLLHEPEQASTLLKKIHSQTETGEPSTPDQ